MFGVFATPSPVIAQTLLESGFAAAIRGCEEWVTNPTSWEGRLEAFPAFAGPEVTMELVESVSEASLPPPSFRVANLYWGINSSETDGFILIVSEELPMCHITGGGTADLQPVVETVLSGAPFLARWEKFQNNIQKEMVSTVYRNRLHPTFHIMINRAAKPDQWSDRLQVVAMAMLDTRQ